MADDHAELDDDILAVSEERAVEQAFDALNLRRLHQWLWLAVVVAGMYTPVLLGEGRWVQAGLSCAAMVANLVLLRSRQAPWMIRDPRQALVAAFLANLLAIQVFHADTGGGLGAWWVLAPLIATRFRLRPGETVTLYLAQYALVVVRLFAQALVTRDSLPFAEATMFLVFAYLPGAGLSLFLSRRYQRRFLSRWRGAADLHRDRLRMKQELEYAREIQLSMLPRGAPEVGWLEVAALSLPATEVGGDYYDYFPIGDGKLAMVVGDVTGHGVASGLVLSGVRSSLNLLQDDLDRPHEILARLNTMLKRTSTPRMLMTLGIAVIDHAAGTLRVATAGHPPILVARAGGEVLEVGMGSCPLGALRRARYEQQAIDLAAEDVVLLYSDGLVEAVNDDGELYGWDRLGASLRLHAAAPTVNAVRDGLLRDVWDFKGDQRQLDDLTMVVARYLPGS
jgi:hypothetical protein